MRRAFFLLPAVLMSTSAFAQSDRAVAEQAIAASADLCPGYSVERANATIRKVPVGALRVLEKHGVVLCPDRRLDDVAVAFHPSFGVFTWNPDVEVSAAALVKVVDAITRSEDFPNESTAWNSDAKVLSNQVLPMFEPRPNARLSRWLQR